MVIETASSHLDLEPEFLLACLSFKLIIFILNINFRVDLL